MTSIAERVERAGEARQGPSREAVLQALSEAEQAFLRATLQLEQRALQDETPRQLREHARYLDLIATEVGRDQRHDAYFTAGLIYEVLSSLTDAQQSDDWRSVLTEGPLADLLRASLMYGAGDHEASSTLAARRVARKLADLHGVNPILSSAARVLLHFLGRDFSAVFRAFR